MATYLSNGKQTLGEVRTHVFDFTNDLRSGVTVLSATGTHTPPSGSAGSVTITASSPYVYATLGTQSVAGDHVLAILATLTDGDKSEIRITIEMLPAVSAVSSRAGLADLRDELRAMCDVTPNDWKIGKQAFWDDGQLDKVLDRHAVDIDHYLMTPQLTYTTTAGTVAYYDYAVPFGNLEGVSSGTAYFLIQDATNASHGSSEWTADYTQGIVTFGTNTSGSAMYLTAYAYDLNAAAADIWRRKASHYTTAVDFSTDNHSISRGKVIENCFRMAEYFESRAGNTNPGADTIGFTVLDVVRDDLVTLDTDED